MSKNFIKASREVDCYIQWSGACDSPLKWGPANIFPQLTEEDISTLNTKGTLAEDDYFSFDYGDMVLGNIGSTQRLISRDNMVQLITGLNDINARMKEDPKLNRVEIEDELLEQISKPIPY